jgi:hypothetical protein
MTKKTFFLLSAAIAVLIASALSSCEKDSYIKSDIQETFFKIVDANHINTYDQYDIICERDKEVSFEIRPQDDQVVIDTLFVNDDETLERELAFNLLDDDVIIEEESLLFAFKYHDASRFFENKIRILGILQKAQRSTPDNPEYLYCKSNVVLKATVKQISEKEIDVLYELKCEDILMASAIQKFDVFNFPED